MIRHLRSTTKSQKSFGRHQYQPAHLPARRRRLFCLPRPRRYKTLSQSQHLNQHQLPSLPSFQLRPSLHLYNHRQRCRQSSNQRHPRRQ
jgi:hypothetical protein